MTCGENAALEVGSKAYHLINIKMACAERKKNKKQECGEKFAVLGVSNGMPADRCLSAFTPILSKSYIMTALVPRFGYSFVLRCFQDLSIWRVATQQCIHNWYTRGADPPFLSY